ncbi:MAG: metal-sensitive transcriptional regulator [Bdellovibrio sp.]|nr:metal-sensitive transcriptional regulator [Bdellovibrio sp.]
MAVLKSQLAHDHSAELKRLSRIKGQVEGVERMIVEKRYCPEIVNQIKAIRAALRSLEANVIEGHMRHCVNQAIKSRDPQIVQEKLEEIVMLMKGQG